MTSKAELLTCSVAQNKHFKLWSKHETVLNLLFHILKKIIMKMRLTFRALSVKEHDGTYFQLTANKSLVSLQSRDKAHYGADIAILNPKI